jgi:hypothetical protein
MTGRAGAHRGVALIDVHRRHSRDGGRIGIDHEAPLNGAGGGILEWRENHPEPARLQHHVLVDQTDDRVRGLADAGVHGSCCSDPLRLEHPHRAPRLELPEDRRGSVGAAIVNGDDFDGPPIPLREDCLQRAGKPALAVVNGHDEADTGGGHAPPGREMASP